MKFAVFFATLLLGVPTLVIMAQRRRVVEDLLLSALVIANTVAIDINLVSYERYRGTSRGAEVGLVDIIALALLLIRLTAPRWRTTPLHVPRGWLLYLLYVALCVPSSLLSAAPHFAAFELLKFARGALLFFLVAQVVRDDEALGRVLRAMAAALVLEALVTVRQRYMLGLFRAPGTFDHANVMSMWSYVQALMVWPWALTTTDRRERWLGIAAVSGASGCVVVALSRGAILAHVLGLTIGLTMLVVSAARRLGFGSRALRAELAPIKRVLKPLALAALFALPVAADTLYKRFVVGNPKGTEGRLEKNAAAMAMARERLFGVGLNNYALLAGPDYKFGDYYTLGLEYEAKKDGPVYRAPVHNLYLLVAAESGWPTLAVFVVLLLALLASARRAAKSARTRLQRVVGVGAFSALAAIMAHSLLEYQLRVTNIWYLFFIIVGLADAARRLAQRRPAGCPATSR